MLLVGIILLALVGVVLIYWLVPLLPYLRLDDVLPRERRTLAGACRDALAIDAVLHGRRNRSHMAMASVVGAYTAIPALYRAELVRWLTTNLALLEKNLAQIAAREEAGLGSYLRSALDDMYTRTQSVRGVLTDTDITQLQQLRSDVAVWARAFKTGMPRLVELGRVWAELHDQIVQLRESCKDAELQAVLAQVECRVNAIRRISVTFCDHGALEQIEREMLEARDLLNTLQDHLHQPRDTEDPWTTLGVAPGTAEAEVKRAYHEKMRAYHPDVWEAVVARMTDPTVRDDFMQWLSSRTQAVRQAYTAIAQQAGGIDG